MYYARNTMNLRLRQNYGTTIGDVKFVFSTGFPLALENGKIRIVVIIKGFKHLFRRSGKNEGILGSSLRIDAYPEIGDANFRCTLWTTITI